VSIKHFPGLVGLADALSVDAERLAERWDLARRHTAGWLASQPDLLGSLREQLIALPPSVAVEVAAGSRETTTHFAWQLVAEEELPFSFWLHEYKPRRDWWVGYANSVHNHRYHFCTTVLAGGYQHEWWDVRFDPTGELVREITCHDTEVWRPGSVRSVTADRFHRVPRAIDGTLTFLVKSDQVRGWSTSVDPATKVSRRHVPVEILVHSLATRI
jgi:hypothetical protein